MLAQRHRGTKRGGLVLALCALFVTVTPAQAFASSSRSDMVVAAPHIAALYGPFAGGIRHEYSATATWKWRDEEYANDTGKGGVNEPAKIGGEDGFAIRLDSNLEMLSYSLTICGNGKIYHCRTFRQPDTSDSSGAGFMEQDILNFIQTSSYPPDYASDNTMFSGKEKVTFTARRGCLANVQAFSRYAHTWSSTAVNSISISKDSIGFGWEHSGHQWALASQPSNAVRVCH